MTTIPNHRRPETKSMGLARYRNQLEDRSLGRRLEMLTSRYRGSCHRLRAEIGILEDRLKRMSPSSAGKPLICPKGLSETEKAQYKKLRRHSYTPSMTLEEFDMKMTHFRQTLRAYRRQSLSAKPEDTVFEDAGIIDLEEHEFCAPLTKHKHTMKEAWKRATTTPKAAEVSPQFLHTVSKPRNRSESSAPKDSASSVGHKQKPFHRSVSQPGNVTPEAVVSPPSSSGRSRTSGARPMTAHPGFPRSLGERTVPVPRCRSAAASGRQGDRRPGIVLCPDYIAARRMSLESGSGSGSYPHSSKTGWQHV